MARDYPWGDERGHRQQYVRPFLVDAIELERARLQGQALGLTVDEVAMLEAEAIEEARGSLTTTRADAMHRRLERVAAGVIWPSEPRTAAEQFGVLASHVRRLRDQVLLGVLGRPIEWLSRRSRRSRR